MARVALPTPSMRLACPRCGRRLTGLRCPSRVLIARCGRRVGLGGQAADPALSMRPASARRRQKPGHTPAVGQLAGDAAPDAAPDAASVGSGDALGWAHAAQMCWVRAILSPEGRADPSAMWCSRHNAYPG
jgi:hypothetical protein